MYFFVCRSSRKRPRATCSVYLLLQVCHSLSFWTFGLQCCLYNAKTVLVLPVFAQQRIAGGTQVCIAGEENSVFAQAEVLVDFLLESAGLMNLQPVPELLNFAVQLIVDVQVAATRHRPPGATPTDNIIAQFKVHCVLRLLHEYFTACSTRLTTAHELLRQRGCSYVLATSQPTTLRYLIELASLFRNLLMRVQQASQDLAKLFDICRRLCCGFQFLQQLPCSLQAHRG